MDPSIVLEFLGLASVQWGPNASAPINTQADYNRFASTWPAASGPVPTFAAMQTAWGQIGSAASYAVTQERTASSAAVVATGSVEARLFRAVGSVLVDEINALRDWITSFKAAVAAATTLADLKTRVAALAAMPDRTLAQAKTAIQNAANSAATDGNGG